MGIRYKNENSIAEFRAEYFYMEFKFIFKPGNICEEMPKRLLDSDLLSWELFGKGGLLQVTFSEFINLLDLIEKKIVRNVIFCARAPKFYIDEL